MSTLTRGARRQVVVIDRDLAEEGLVGWWNGLPQPQAMPALRWEYLATWRRAFMPGGARPQTHVALADGRPVAAIALYRHHGVLHAPANDHSDVFDMVYDPAHRAAADHLAAALLRRRIHLARLDGRSPLLGALRRARPPMILETDASPYIRLPETADELLTARSSRFRANVRKARRALETLGEVSFQDHRGGEAGMHDAFAAMLGVEAASWKGRDGGAIDARPDTLRFYRELALDGPARAWTRLATLRVGDRVVATQLDLEAAGRRAGLRTSFVDDLRGRQSPGLVLLWAVLIDGIDRGLRIHDFGGGADAWKRHWTDASSPRATLRAWPATTAGHLTFGARQRIKPVIRPLLRRVGGD